jgi:hypothetical protein
LPALEKRRPPPFGFANEKIMNEGAFSYFKVPKILQDSPSHRIFGRMHEALNIDKKIINYTVWL